MHLKIIIICLLFISQLFIPAFASTFHGYITNKIYKPLKLKVYEIDKEALFNIERNLEDNSFLPYLNLKVIAENTLDYLQTENNIFIPEGTRLSGYISEIIPPKSFNRKGYFKVNFEEVICPDGQKISLKPEITSRSQTTIYNPIQHVGKTTLGLIGGSLAGTLLSLQLGSLGLAVATHGYSLAAGATAGGFLGTTATLVGKGKTPTIEPGDGLTIVPVDEISLNELKQITCNKAQALEAVETNNIENLNLEILSVKEKKDLLGENRIKINIRLKNSSDKIYRLNNFFLKDSEGKEYSVTFSDFKDDPFVNFPPNETKTTQLEFLVDHPKAKHWLILKDKYFTSEVGKWKIEKGS